jgi:hypothetical protein
MPFVLYKNAVQLDTLEIVRFLHAARVPGASPASCVERAWPQWVTELPAIKDLDDGTLYVGMQRCVSFWEARSGVSNLRDRARAFSEQHPAFRVQR